jgi:1-acyl-sn-glycerol-3-phosphate acyltransferase
MVLLGATVWGFFMGTFGVLPFVLIPRGRREKYTMVAGQIWARGVLAMLGVRLTVHGRWPLAPHQGALVFCNHRSWLDPLALMAVVKCNGLSKMEILLLPFIGVYGWLAGAVFFNRHSKGGRQRARDEVLFLVGSGHRLVVFPEATRQRGDAPGQRVYLRLAMDCYNRGLPVVPCAIYNSDASLPPDEPAAWPLAQVVLAVEPALQPDEFDSAREFAQAAWQRVCDRYGELQADGLPKAPA